MNGSLTISARDKRLLYWTALTLFLGAFFSFFLLPALAAHREAAAALATAEQTQSEMEAAIAQADAAAADAADARTALAGKSPLYEPLMDSPELDALITGLTLDHKLSPLSLTITGITPPNVTGYVASASAGQHADANGAACSLRVATLDCTASGSRDAFAALLDDLAEHHPAIQLVRCEVTDQSYLTPGGGVATEVRFAYTLDVYMNDEGALLE